MPPRVFSLAALTLVLGAHLVAMLWTPYIGHDVAAYLSAAQVLLRGEWAGVGIVDTNPPMVLYLSAFPVMAAAWLHLPIAAASLFFYFLITALGGVLFVRAVRAALDVPAWVGDLLLALWFSLSLRTYTHLGPLVRDGDFGQRDAILFAWLAPLLVVRYARYADRLVPPLLAWTCAACAAIAIGMKPFFVLPLAAAELLFALTLKRARPMIATIDWWIIIGVGAFYLASLPLLPGGPALLSDWMPQIVRGYSAYNRTPHFVVGQMLREPNAHIWLAGLALLCSHPFWKGAPRASLPGAFGVFGACSLLLYLLQGKGWTYHLWPYFGAVTIGAGLLLVDVFRDGTLSRNRAVALGCACAAILTLVAPTQLWLTYQPGVRFSAPPLRVVKDKMAQVIEALSRSDDRVLTLSTSVGDTYPALTYTGRLPATRFFACAFPIAFYFAGTQDYQVPAAWRTEEASFYSALLEDVRLRSPRLVFVHDAVSQALPPDFRILEYMRRRGFFSDALANYEEVGRVGPFVLYVRGDARPGSPPAAGLLSPQTREIVSGLRQRRLIWTVQ